MKNSKLIVLCLYLLFSGCKEYENANLYTELIVPNRIDTTIKERIQNDLEDKIYLAKINLNEPIQYKFYGELDDSKLINDVLQLIIFSSNKSQKIGKFILS